MLKLQRRCRGGNTAVVEKRVLSKVGRLKNPALKFKFSPTRDTATTTTYYYLVVVVLPVAVARWHETLDAEPPLHSPPMWRLVSLLLAAQAVALTVVVNTTAPLALSSPYLVSHGWEAGQAFSALPTMLDPRAIATAAHLSPGIIRVGGISADWLRFVLEEGTGAAAAPPLQEQQGLQTSGYSTGRWRPPTSHWGSSTTSLASSVPLPLLAVAGSASDDAIYDAAATRRAHWQWQPHQHHE
jgi:hypothetical protein